MAGRRRSHRPAFLRHVKDQQNAGQLGENDELLEEGGHILVRQRIVERSVPGVEHDLAVGRGTDDDDKGYAEEQDLSPLWRAPKDA